MVDMTAHLEQARQHVVDAENHLGEQRATVKRLAGAGDSLTIAKRVLDSFESTLSVMKRYLEAETELIATLEDDVPRRRGPFV